jgi:ABC-type phosphate/phosphonate transport system ATPase subunit
VVSSKLCFNDRVYTPITNVGNISTRVPSTSNVMSGRLEYKKTTERKLNKNNKNKKQNIFFYNLK